MDPRRTRILAGSLALLSAGLVAGEDKEIKRLQACRSVLEEMAKERPLRVAPDVASFLLFGMMNWTYTWYDPKRDGTAADLAEAVRGIFLKGVLA